MSYVQYDRNQVTKFVTKLMPILEQLSHCVLTKSMGIIGYE